MEIKELRISFVQVECLTQPLRSLTPPDIPFNFLLSGPLYQKEFADAIKGGGVCRPPWLGGYGKLFWKYYIQKKPAPPKDLWRAMVPLYYELGTMITAAWLNGTVAARAYLYPWGIGLVVDIHATGYLTLEKAVQLGFQARRLNKYQIDLGSGLQEIGLNSLVEVLLAAIRFKVYGPAVAAGQSGEIFSVVTVVDAEGVDAAKPVAEGSNLHRSLDALVNWNSLYKKTKPKILNESRIETMQAPDGHVLYGGSRGRCVWFPGNFRSSQAEYPERLVCYHQNLTVASLQTESLCRMAKDTADLLESGHALADSSLTYQTYAKLAVGTLGRLYGGTSTYRSHSIRKQIAGAYQASVSAVRKQFGMEELKG